MEHKIVTINNKQNSSVDEAYRILRSNIQFCSFEKSVNTITITSSNPGEGKSTTSANLGISLANAGKRVLLVDADMRTPVLSKYIGSSGLIGLSNYISGRSEFKDIIEKTDVDNLSFVGSGIKPPNPVELLSSAKFVSFLTDAQTQFDVVIIDTPPLGSVIDAAVIASHTDGALLVIRANSTNYKTVQRVKDQLKKANARILGVVINKMKKSDYRNYYSFYNHYNNRNLKEKKVPKTAGAGQDGKAEMQS